MDDGDKLISGVYLNGLVLDFNPFTDKTFWLQYGQSDKFLLTLSNFCYITLQKKNPLY